MTFRASLILSAAFGFSVLCTGTPAFAQTPAPAPSSTPSDPPSNPAALPPGTTALPGSPERSPDLVSDPVTVPIPTPTPEPTPNPAPVATSPNAGTAPAGVEVIAAHVGDLPAPVSVKTVPGHGMARRAYTYDVDGGTLTLVGRGEGFTKAGAVTFITRSASLASDMRRDMEAALGAPDTARGIAVWNAPQPGVGFADNAQVTHAVERGEDIFRIERRIADANTALSLQSAADPKRKSTRSMTPPPPPAGPGTANIRVGNTGTGVSAARPLTPLED